MSEKMMLISIGENNAIALPYDETLMHSIIDSEVVGFSMDYTNTHKIEPRPSNSVTITVMSKAKFKELLLDGKERIIGEIGASKF